MKKLLQIFSASLVLAAAGVDADAMNVQIREGRPVVDDVFVNGHGPYRFLVDTGATVNHLDLRLARSVGLAATFHTTLTSSTGITPVSGSSGLEVTLGSVRAVNQTFLFAGLDTIRQTWSDIQGVLGQDFLSHFNYMLDMRNKQLEFGRRECDVKGIQTLYRIDHGRPVVSTSLGWLVLDSGADRLIRFRVKAAEETLEMRTISGTAKLGAVSSTLTIAGRSLWRGDAIALPQSPEAGVDGLLPASLFKSVYVCNSEGYVIFN